MTGLPFTMACWEQDEYRRWRALDNACLPASGCSFWDAAPLLPKGTILKVTAWHDTTAAKKSNPDPNHWVGWGDRTVDEMAHAWINIVYMSDADFAVEQQKRQSANTQQQ